MLSFLSLPPEVRNDVYKRTLVIPVDYVIDFTEPMTFESSYPPKFSTQRAQLTRSTNQHSSFEVYDDAEQYFNGKPKMPNAQLLRTCKQIDEEAAYFLYGMNTFAFEMPRHFKDFYKMAKLKNVIHVRHLQINYLLHVKWGSQFTWGGFKVNEQFAMDRIYANCPCLVEIKALYFDGVRGVRGVRRGYPKELQKKALEQSNEMANAAGYRFWNSSETVRAFPLLEAENISNEIIFTDNGKKPLVQKIIFKVARATE